MKTSKWPPYVQNKTLNYESDSTYSGEGLSLPGKRLDHTLPQQMSDPKQGITVSQYPVGGQEQNQGDLHSDAKVVFSSRAKATEKEKPNQEATK